MQPNLGIITLLTMRCNYHCGHCSSNSSIDREEFISSDDVLNVLEDMSSCGANLRHLVSGGEPTLHPKLHDVLEASIELGYRTLVVTNGSWIDPRDYEKTQSFFYKTFPEGGTICCSFDLEHLQQDPHILERIDILGQLTRDRNGMKIDGAYNGIEERMMIEDYMERCNSEYLRSCDRYLVPRQNVGRSKGKPNYNILREEQLYCPKGSNCGFVLHPEGTYYCLRGALNQLDKYRLAGTHYTSDIVQNLERFNPDGINQGITESYRQLKGIRTFNHPCDLCELI